MDQHLLSIILFTPLAGLLVLLLIPSKSKDLIRIWANLAAFAGFLVSLPLVSRFQTGAAGFQFEGRESLALTNSQAHMALSAAANTDEF